MNIVSIIIVNWNGKKWLEKCLDSFKSQTYKNYEIILVDNASSDDSVEFVTKNYPHVIIVKSKKNLGFAGGNNLGVKQANGNYLLFLNNDVWVEADFVEKLMSFYKRNHFDIIGPLEADYYNGEKRLPYISTIDLFGHYIYLPMKSKSNNFYLTGVCFLTTKQLYSETQGLDDDFFMYCEEVDWFWRTNLLGKTCAHVNNVFVYHACSGSTGSGIKYNTFLWRNQNTLQMLLKNYASYNLVWVLPIYFIQNVIEILFFLLILKPKISLSYVEGWWFNLKNFNKILKKRDWVQKNRKIGDIEIIKKMYFGLGKLHHMVKFFLSLS